MLFIYISQDLLWTKILLTKNDFLESVGAFHMNKILSDHIFKPEDWETSFSSTGIGSSMTEEDPDPDTTQDFANNVKEESVSEEE